MCVVDQLCRYFETIYFQYLGTSPGTASFPVAFLSFISLTAFPLHRAKYKDLSRLQPLPLQFRHVGFLVY
jgi:hypothetical protein